MKLPEYDNHPAPGEPLHTDKKDSEWDDIKFPLLAIGLPILLVYCFSLTIVELIALFKTLLR